MYVLKVYEKLIVVECKGVNGEIDWLKLIMGQPREDGLVIHRELPVLEVDTEH
jgi:hypothetical protein